VAAFVALLTFSDDEDLRLKTRPTHREYLRALFDAGKLRTSGPWADDTGAMLIYEAVDLSEAQRLLDHVLPPAE
jgi:uncharacterized protein YciI